MNSLMWRVIITLVLIFGGGWFLGGALNAAALVSPQLVSKIECPAGTTVKMEMVQQSFDEPGQKTLTFQCVDQSGNRVPTRPEAEISAAEYRIFYTAGVVVMAILVAAWYIRSAVRGRMGAGANSATA